MGTLADESDSAEIRAQVALMKTASIGALRDAVWKSVTDPVLLANFIVDTILNAMQKEKKTGTCQVVELFFQTRLLTLVAKMTAAILLKVHGTAWGETLQALEAGDDMFRAVGIISAERSSGKKTPFTGEEKQWLQYVASMLNDAGSGDQAALDTAMRVSPEQEEQMTDHAWLDRVAEAFVRMHRTNFTAGVQAGQQALIAATLFLQRLGICNLVNLEISAGEHGRPVPLTLAAGAALVPGLRVSVGAWTQRGHYSCVKSLQDELLLRPDQHIELHERLNPVALNEMWMLCQQQRFRGQAVPSVATCVAQPASLSECAKCAEAARLAVEVVQAPCGECKQPFERIVATQMCCFECNVARNLRSKLRACGACNVDLVGAPLTVFACESCSKSTEERKKAADQAEQAQRAAAAAAAQADKDAARKLQQTEAKMRFNLEQARISAEYNGTAVVLIPCEGEGCSRQFAASKKQIPGTGMWKCPFCEQKDRLTKQAAHAELKAKEDAEKKARDAAAASIATTAAAVAAAAASAVTAGGNCKVPPPPLSGPPRSCDCGKPVAATPSRAFMCKPCFDDPTTRKLRMHTKEKGKLKSAPKTGALAVAVAGPVSSAVVQPQAVHVAAAICGCGKTKEDKSAFCKQCITQQRPKGLSKQLLDAWDAYEGTNHARGKETLAAYRTQLQGAWRRGVPEEIMLRALRDKKICLYGSCCDRKGTCWREHPVAAVSPPASASGVPRPMATSAGASAGAATPAVAQAAGGCCGSASPELLTEVARLNEALGRERAETQRVTQHMQALETNQRGWAATSGQWNTRQPAAAYLFPSQAPAPAYVSAPVPLHVPSAPLPVPLPPAPAHPLPAVPQVPLYVQPPPAAPASVPAAAHGFGPAAPVSMEQVLQMLQQQHAQFLRMFAGSQLPVPLPSQ